MTTVDLRAFDRVEGRTETLDNGLRVVLLPQSGAESIVVALCYRAGSRDEELDESGLAHFLEHMMFKGSAAYEPGAIDRLTQGLGGTNNAFTSHDATVYHFQFERGSWQEALRIESDRMRGLSLLPAEVELEREVILEEIRMVEDDPWDALEQAVAGQVFGDHPYGRSVLGTRESLRGLDAAALRAFHRRHYRPRNAVLVCAGGLPRDAMERIEETLGAVRWVRGSSDPPTGGAAERRSPDNRDAGQRPATMLDAACGGSGSAPGWRVPAPAASQSERPSSGGRMSDPRTQFGRIELRRGETPRLLVVHPAPLPDDPVHVHLRLALAVLCSGRSSRVQRDLVEKDPLALWASATVTGHRLGGMATLSAEAAPGVHPERLEEELYGRLEGLASGPPDAEELERAKRILFADWVFLHEPIAERAMTAALEYALYSPGFSRDSFRALADATAADVAGACEAWLSAETRVVGWSLPADRSVRPPTLGAPASSPAAAAGGQAGRPAARPAPPGRRGHAG